MSSCPRKNGCSSASASISGDVIAEENDLYGTGVNVAARLEQLAEPGGICVSQTVYDQVRKIVEIPFQDIGERRLKNISEPVHVYRIAPEPLPWSSRVLLARQCPSRSRRRAGTLVLFLAVAAGSFYLRQPAALWDAVLGNPAKLPEHPAIVVLPFDDMSSTQDQQYLADGITEELITGLAKNSRAAGHGAHCELCLQGQAYGRPADEKGSRRSLHRRWQHTTLRPRRARNGAVDRGGTGRELWVESYDRQIGNIFAIRDEITRSIAGTLGGLSGKLAKAEVTRLSGKDPNSFTAYDYLMRGWYEWHKFTPESNAAARELFEKARKIDPNYARAYVGLSLGLCQ